MALRLTGMWSGIEWFCRWVGIGCLGLMLCVVAAEVILRSFFGMSLGFADEVSAYLLVALCFFSLSVTHTRNGFHKVDFLVEALPPRPKAVLVLLGNLVATVFAAVILWQFALTELQALKLGSVAPTMLRTPQWIPVLPMVAGSFLFLLTLLRTCAEGLARVFGPPPAAPDSPTQGHHL